VFRNQDKGEQTEKKKKEEGRKTLGDDLVDPVTQLQNVGSPVSEALPASAEVVRGTVVVVRGSVVHVLSESRVGRDGVPGDGDSLPDGRAVGLGTRGLEMAENEIELLFDVIDSSVVGFVVLVVELVDGGTGEGDGQKISLSSGKRRGDHPLATEPKRQYEDEKKTHDTRTLGSDQGGVVGVHRGSSGAARAHRRPGNRRSGSAVLLGDLDLSNLV
jgi:hypothetical protein